MQDVVTSSLPAEALQRTDSRIHRPPTALLDPLSKLHQIEGMCGRFSDLFTWAELHALYSIHDQPAPNLVSRHSASAERLPTGGRGDNAYRPRYNFAPKQFGAVIRLTATGERELVKMRWGLVPSWAKDDKLAFKTINARCETVATSPAFRGAYRERFALKTVSSFFEWPKGQNPRLFTTAPPEDPAAPRSPTGGGPFAFAALWESWRPKEAREESQEELLTFTILTSEPNDFVRPYHDRMPADMSPAAMRDPRRQARFKKARDSRSLHCWRSWRAHLHAFVVHRILPRPSQAYLDLAFDPHRASDPAEPGHRQALEIELPLRHAEIGARRHAEIDPMAKRCLRGRPCIGNVLDQQVLATRGRQHGFGNAPELEDACLGIDAAELRRMAFGRNRHDRKDDRRVVVEHA
ncbi:MAG: SOS response-associated peptidase [Alphaproteobacteria bacterium]|nr:SOS response-associated peptidase [Alphaproteobacteria bacterium]